MRHIKYLISEAKQNTNTTDIEAISDYLCTSLLNRFQEYIQASLFTSNIESKIFRGQASFKTVLNADTYQLPFNIYAKNSINAVLRKDGNSYSEIKQIAEKGRVTNSGYFCSDNKIILCPMPTSSIEINLSYTKKIPKLSLSYGEVLSVIPNVSITLITNPSLPLVSSSDFYFSVIDKYGKVIRSFLEFNQTGYTISLSDTTGIQPGMFIMAGSYSTTHSELPDELESSLILGLEQAINARLSSKDLQMSKIFSEEMLGQILAMFSESTTDTFMPPILENSEWV